MVDPDAATLSDAETLLALVRAERVEGPVAWPRIARLAAGEGVAPLLHDVLERTPTAAAAVPGHVRAEFRRAYERTWARTSVLTARWDELRTTLERAGIRAI